jgi:hypothetical protein
MRILIGQGSISAVVADVPGLLVILEEDAKPLERYRSAKGKRSAQYAIKMIPRSSSQSDLMVVGTKKQEIDATQITCVCKDT